MTAAQQQQRFRVYLAFALVYVFWGSTYLAIRIAVEHIPAALLGGVRFLIAGPLMLAFCALSGRKVRIAGKDVWLLLAMGTLLLSGGNVLLCYSEEYVPSGLAALIVAVVPIWVAVAEMLLPHGDRLRARGWFGLALGLAGLGVLLWPELAPLFAPQGRAELHPAVLIACGALLIGSISWTIGSVISRHSRLGIGPIAATGWEMTFAGMVNMAVAISIGDLHQVQWSARGIGAIAYLMVFGSWVGFTAYIWLLEHVPTPKVATYAYVNPIVAVFLGWLVEGERVDRYILMGAVIIVAAVALVTSSARSTARAGEAAVLPAVEAEA